MGGWAGALCPGPPGARAWSGRITGWHGRERKEATVKYVLLMYADPAHTQAMTAGDRDMMARNMPRCGLN